MQRHRGPRRGTAAAALVAVALAAGALSALGPTSPAAAAVPSTVLAGGGVGDGAPAAYAMVRGFARAVYDATTSTWVFANGAGSIMRIDTTGIARCLAGCSPTDGMLGDGGAAVSAEIRAVSDIAMAPDGSVVIIDRNRVRRIVPGGVITTIAGTGAAAPVWQTSGPATQIDLTPQWLAVGPDGSVYVSDDIGQSPPGPSRTSAIRRIDTNGNLTTVAGRGPTASASYWDRVNPASATSVDLGWIGGMTALPDGSVVFATQGHSIGRWTSEGTITRVAGQPHDGNAYVADAGDGGRAVDAEIAFVLGLAWDGTGIVLATDGDLPGNVRRFTIGGSIEMLHPGVDARLLTGGPGVIAFVPGRGNGTVLESLAPDGTRTIIAGGHWAQVGDGGPAAGAWFDRITGALRLPDGRTLISDGPVGLIRQLGTDGRMSTWAGSPAQARPTFTGEGGSALQAFIPAPGELARMPNGDVLVVCGDGTVRRISATDGTITTLVGTGIVTTNSPTPKPASSRPGREMPLAFPRSLAVTADGAVWFVDVDYDNALEGRLMRWQGGLVEQVTATDPVAADVAQAVGRSAGAVRSAYAVSIDPDGDVLFTGWTASEPGRFGLSGGSIVESSPEYYFGAPFAVEPDGRVIVGGGGGYVIFPSGAQSPMGVPGRVIAKTGPTVLSVEGPLVSALPRLREAVVPTSPLPGGPPVPVVSVSTNQTGTVIAVNGSVGPAQTVTVVANAGSRVAATPKDGIVLGESYSPGQAAWWSTVVAKLPWGSPATVTAFTLDGVTGAVSARRVLPVTPGLVSTCKLVRSRAAISAGGSVALTATLWGGPGALPPPISGGAGTWRIAPVGGSAWNLAALRTSASGSTVLTAKPSANTRYTYTSAATQFLPCSTNTMDVAVSSVVTMKASATKVAVGRSVTFSGTTAPRHPGWNLQLQRYQGGRWVWFRTVKAGSTGAVSTSVTMTSRTDYYWRFVLPAHSDHAVGISPTIKVVVP